MKKFLSVLLILVLLFAFASCVNTDKHTVHVDENNDGLCDVCGEKMPDAHTEHVDADGDGKCDVCGAAMNDAPAKTKLATPANVNADSETALITWDAVENATGYVVTVNGEEIAVATNAYQADASVSFTYTVAATADGYLASDASELKVHRAVLVRNVSVALSGPSEVKGGKSVVISAFVSGGLDNSVTWSVKSGGEYAEISQTGKLTAKEVDSDKQVVVVATSNEDNTKFAEKTINVAAQPTLTQAMLNELKSDKIAFEGNVRITLYTIGQFSHKYSDNSIIDIKTAMDGDYWYARYESSTGVYADLYFKNNNDVACQVGLSFLNKEEYSPMVDENNNPVSWVDAGLYNNFKNLTVDDFTFDKESWSYVYSGADESLPAKMIASANPYDFKPLSFSLIIEEDMIVGIYAQSDDDYQIADGYKAVQELTVAINYGESVDVKKIPTFTYDESVHGALKTALENMHKLDSYTLDYRDASASAYTSTVKQTGFVETITADNCYFVPYAVSYRGTQEIVTPDPTAAYGYKKVNDNLYNTYLMGESGFVASRAYEKSFQEAKPTFAFAPEIFREYSRNNDGSTTYYVDNIMCAVASTFYYGVGNDIQLYGLFAAEGRLSSTVTFTPYVTVKDGYIVSARFYYSMGYMYGVVDLTYGDFNTAALPDDVNFAFQTRFVPASWDQVTIFVSADTGSTQDDVETNALTYLKQYFNDDAIGEKLPFFGDVLGDTYGFGLTTTHIAGGSGVARSAIVLYYDVPLDLDYTINSSMKAAENYLLQNGYEKNQYGEFHKNNIYVAVVDSSLDFTIYVWKV